MNTILLVPGTWDLCADASGNIAQASGAYALAQDVASAIRTFLSEVYYDTTLGIPFFSQILNPRGVPLALIKAQVVAAALTVPGVVNARCLIASIADRQITGQCQFTDDSGSDQTVIF